MCSFPLELRLGLPAECVKWNIRLGSMEPERVAPGRPASGVRPIDVSSEVPLRMQHAEAPEPRCKAMRLSEDAGLDKWDDTACTMKA